MFVLGKLGKKYCMRKINKAVGWLVAPGLEKFGELDMDGKS